MPITLGDLRTFCRERASPDSSGATAAREFMDWINGAFARLYREAELDVTRRETRIFVPSAEEGNDLVLVQGSLDVERASGFDPKWLTERWAFHIRGEGKQEFELASVEPAPDNNLGAFRAGDEWVLPSASDVEFVVVKNKFPLPQAQEVSRVEVLQVPREIVVLPPTDFDHVKQRGGPTQRGVHPRFCTFRNGYLEVFPSPGVGAPYKLGITYRLAFEPFSDDADDDTEVEWDPTNLDVLKKAILIEAGITQGENAPVPYQIALREYLEGVGKLRDMATKDQLPGRLMVRTPIMPRGRGRISEDWIGSLEDM